MSEVARRRLSLGRSDVPDPGASEMLSSSQGAGAEVVVVKKVMVDAPMGGV